MGISKMPSFVSVGSQSIHHFMTNNGVFGRLFIQKVYRIIHNFRIEHRINSSNGLFSSHSTWIIKQGNSQDILENYVEAYVFILSYSPANCTQNMKSYFSPCGVQIYVKIKKLTFFLSVVEVFWQFFLRFAKFWFCNGQRASKFR